LIKHDLLQPDELPIPGKGTLVSIDAEFVLMQQVSLKYLFFILVLTSRLAQEETEFRSDGTKKVLRPARLSLARVSVLRGDGARKGVPFIDDYIHTSEIIVDYLTEFSGIKCNSSFGGILLRNIMLIIFFLVGDLDPMLSRYTLTPLKLVYKKLRRLVDCGCIFIGHGLSKDFRIISMTIHLPSYKFFD
jgi:PAB-dependent poly(A)-specific ribonuclease subunit 2